MFKIECSGNEYFVRRDRYQWILVQMIDGKDREGNPKKQERETYHVTLEQVCSNIIDRQCGKCTSVEELTQLLKETKTAVTMKFTKFVEK